MAVKTFGFNKQDVEFVLSYNEMMSLISDYAIAKAMLSKIEEDCGYDDDWLFENAEYQYILSSAVTAETWMRCCGVAPDSAIVCEMIEKEKKLIKR